MDQVVQKLDCAIYQINIYPLESGSGFHPLVSDLADGQRYPSSEQPGPCLACENGRFPWLLSWSQLFKYGPILTGQIPSQRIN